MKSERRIGGRRECWRDFIWESYLRNHGTVEPYYILAEDCPAMTSLTRTKSHHRYTTGTQSQQKAREISSPRIVAAQLNWPFLCFLNRLK